MHGWVNEIREVIITKANPKLLLRNKIIKNVHVKSWSIKTYTNKDSPQIHINDILKLKYSQIIHFSWRFLNARDVTLEHFLQFLYTVETLLC